MKKTLLGAAAAIAVAAVAFSGSANAACYWNGYNWNCASPQIYYQPHTYQYGYQPYYGYSQPDSYLTVPGPVNSADHGTKEMSGWRDSLRGSSARFWRRSR